MPPKKDFCELVADYRRSARAFERVIAEQCEQQIRDVVRHSALDSGRCLHQAKDEEDLFWAFIQRSLKAAEA